MIAPFLLTSGGVVLVNRGFIPQSYAKSDARKHSPQGDVTLTGVMRAPQSRNYFTPADDPEHGLWFTSDPEKIAKSFGLSEAAPFTVVLDPTIRVLPSPMVCRIHLRATSISPIIIFPMP